MRILAAWRRVANTKTCFACFPLSAGMDDDVAKPVRAPELKAIVRKWGVPRT